ncbi:MAG: hypothetical protein GY749_01460 [Desulfobacteraceae bacterium]|nr:hypothetical protein [Desulfobacteraceae bacterium]
MKTNDMITSTVQDISAEATDMDEWKNIWDEWSHIVNEVGDEQGKYAAQDNHWEAPYFNGHDLAEDLEKIAERMLPLLDKVFASDQADDGIFELAIRKIEDNIEKYPEQMEAEDSECYVGNNVTRCMLRWKWLLADSPMTFLNNVLKLEDDLRIIEIDNDAVIDFFLELPDDARKQIYDHITSNSDNRIWKKRLDSSFSSWHHIYHAFSGDFNPAAYLDSCRRMLHENWKYGLPLIEDLLKKKDDPAAEKVCTQTVASFAEQFTHKEWEPEGYLLVYIMMYGYGAPDRSVIKILADWTRLAEKLEMTKKAMALKLQLVTYQTPHNWDQVAEVIRETDLSLMSDLFEQWQMFILTTTLKRSFVIGDDSKDCWIKWLMDAGIDRTKGKPWFSKAMKGWLTNLSSNSKMFRNQQEMVEILTYDLAGITDLEKQYPYIVKLVQKDIHLNRERSKSRQEWLKKTDGKRHLPLLMECWKKSAARMVPNPANVHTSNYDEHALWMGVVSELDPAACSSILDQWRIDHKRRKNLWNAIREIGLPV